MSDIPMHIDFVHTNPKKKKIESELDTNNLLVFVFKRESISANK